MKRNGWPESAGIGVRNGRNTHIISDRRLANADNLPAEPGTIGGMFDIFYGLKELHSREGISPGRSLVISPTEEYNGCYGWLEFQPLLKAPFVTVAQTGSIGEAFVQMEPCAPNDDCLVLLPKIGNKLHLAHLVIAAGTIHTERWRFTYGRKLTPQRICDFPIPSDDDLVEWTKLKIKDLQKVVRRALKPYEDALAE